MTRPKEKPAVIVISGPTGCGKSRIAIELAKKIGGEIVNADSVQLYRDFDIGSSKPTAEEMAGVPHHLFSVVSPTSGFDAAQFRAQATAVISDIVERGAVPIVVGGTGLYIRSLLGGIVSIPPIGKRVRTEMAAREKEFDAIVSTRDEFARLLFRWLEAIDPRTASRLQPEDIVRVRRAIAVFLQTGTPLSLLQDHHQHSERSYRALVVIPSPVREALYNRINERVDKMIDSGLVAEVEKLRTLYPETVRPLQSIGYKQIVEFFNGKCELASAIDKIKLETRRYAKRQYTWWRNQPPQLRWIDVTPHAGVENSADLPRVVKCFLGGTGLFESPKEDTPFRITAQVTANRKVERVTPKESTSSGSEAKSSSRDIFILRFH